MAKLPITLPVTIGSTGSGITLPITLPARFGGSSARLRIKIPIYETISDFEGIIFEENIVGTFNEPLLLVEDIRSRILVNAELIDSKTVRLHWYGDSVPAIEVYKKLEVDDTYEKVGTYQWRDNYCDITLEVDSYNIKLEGSGNTGQSEEITIGENFYIDILTQLIMPVNEKTYYLDIDFTSRYDIDADF